MTNETAHDASAPASRHVWINGSFVNIENLLNMMGSWGDCP
jgi:hypothetical protein